jgi:UV DNA damage endonuclease
VSTHQGLFDADEALEAGRAAGVAVVFDFLHHQANPCRRAVRDVLLGSPPTGRPPKVHLSSRAPGGPPGTHAATIDVPDALAFLALAPSAPFNCMLEAKEKDRALLRLREELKARGVVEAHVAR